MSANIKLPDDIELLKAKLLEAINPICSAVGSTKAEKDFLFTAQRTDAGRKLPPYYLCYFLFVDLLGFKNLGQFEKISWSVPLDYKGTAYLLEHRKFGLGLFAADKDKQENEAKEIVKLIHKAVRQARPYFEWRALEASKNSELNVLNHSRRLFSRFEYFLNEYHNKAEEAKLRKDERIVTDLGNGAQTISMPGYELKRNSEWLAISAIDSFFSWTEHIFIHAAALKGNISTGEDVANLADEEWANKFKAALDIKDQHIKPYYDQLVELKRQIRNYIAHGAFGKRGEAFQVHSGAGAIPLLLPHQKGNARFSFQGDLGFDEGAAIKLLKDFLSIYWESKTYPEVIYIKSDLPTILTYVDNGTYKSAMVSVNEMENYVDHLSGEFDRAANMDW